MNSSPRRKRFIAVDKSEHASDFGALPDRVAIHDVPLDPNSRITVKRASVIDPLSRLDLEPPQRQAAMIYRQAFLHVEAGRGMGPMPWSRDTAGHGDGMAWACAQERALTAAEWLREGSQAMGLAAVVGVVNWVVIRELPLVEYDAVRKWRKGTSAAQLRSSLARAAVVYGVG